MCPPGSMLNCVGGDATIDKASASFHLCFREWLPENGAVKKITTNKVTPKASAMFRSAVVLLKKQEPGRT